MTPADSPVLLPDEADEMEPGDSCWWPAVAQQKPALRKRLLAELGGRAHLFSIRTGRGGVTMTRLDDAAE